jgi:hypothetical protein
MQNGTAFVGVGFAGRKGSEWGTRWEAMGSGSATSGVPLSQEGVRRELEGCLQPITTEELSLELGHAGAELVSLLVPIG